jgi:hypothetical protein
MLPLNPFQSFVLHGTWAGVTTHPNNSDVYPCRSMFGELKPPTNERPAAYHARTPISPQLGRCIVAQHPKARPWNDWQYSTSPRSQRHDDRWSTGSKSPVSCPFRLPQLCPRHAQDFVYMLTDHALVLQAYARTKPLVPSPFDPVFVPPSAAGIGFLGFRRILVKRRNNASKQVSNRHCEAWRCGVG